MTMYRLEELFPDELQTRLEKNPILILPFGTIEWHSHHLPLGLDGLVAAGICQKAAEQARAVLAPVSYLAADGVPYPYTLKLPGELLHPVYTTLFDQYASMGFKVIVALTGHFGLAQTLTLKEAALATMSHASATVLPLTEYDLVTEIYKGDHAGTGETSLLWALRPELVRLDAVTAEEALDGVLGQDPRGQAGREKGAALLETIGARTAEMAQRMLSETTAVQRQDYIAALNAGVRVLAQLAAARAAQPKHTVPSVSTPAYLAHCRAMYEGDYRQAKAHAERKLSDLAA